MRRLELTLLMLLVVLLIIVIKSRKDVKQSKIEADLLRSRLDTNGLVLVSYSSMIIHDSNGVPIGEGVVDWSNRTYYDSNGVPIHPIDWSNRIHYDFQLNDYRIRTNRGDRQ